MINGTLVTDAVGVALAGLVLLARKVGPAGMARGRAD